MNFIQPTNVANNVSTQLKRKIEISTNSSSVLLYSEHYKDDRTYNLTSFLNKRVSSYLFQIEEFDTLSNSTWNNSFFDDFDIISKFVFKKNYKIKGRIKIVSRFFPKIVID
jgi:hypothetical protein